MFDWKPRRYPIAAFVQGITLICSCTSVAAAVGGWATDQQASDPRSGHTATSLPDGTILIAGGMGGGAPNGSGILTSAVDYNPVNGTLNPTNMANARYLHTA